MIAFINIYNDYIYELKYENRFNYLIQINSIAFYIQIFQNLVIFLNINNKFQYIIFYNEFNNKIKEAIIIMGCKKKIQFLINQIINLDQIFYQ